MNLSRSESHNQPEAENGTQKKQHVLNTKIDSE